MAKTASFMSHKGCGGRIEADWRKTYHYEGTDYPAYRCMKCLAEIFGDAQITLPGDDK